MEVGKFVDDGVRYSSATAQNLVTKATALAGTGALTYLHAKDLPNLSNAPDFCPAMNVDAILGRPAGYGQDSDPNNNSVVIRLNYNDQSFLFTGDAEDAAEHLLLSDAATRPLLAATVLKAGHHGSNTSFGSRSMVRTPCAAGRDATGRCLAAPGQQSGCRVGEGSSPRRDGGECALEIFYSIQRQMGRGAPLAPRRGLTKSGAALSSDSRGNR